MRLRRGALAPSRDSLADRIWWVGAGLTWLGIASSFLRDTGIGSGVILLAWIHVLPTALLTAVHLRGRGTVTGRSILVKWAVVILEEFVCWALVVAKVSFG